MDAWTRFLKDAEEVISQLTIDGSDMLFFRGQSNSDWSLLPSLFRKDYSKTIENLIYYDFYSYSAPLFNQPFNSWDILFEMRHAGLPTRLLDWTENFAIALFFALRDKSLNKPCIWIMDPYELNEKSCNERVLYNPSMDLEYSYFGGFIEDEETTHEEPIAIFPSMQSKRVFAQKGVFTLHGTKPDPIDSLKLEDLHKLEIPTKALSKAYSFLNLAGINEYSLFPDFDGLARFLIKRHSL